jgi:sRNA-binding regulator protein Hfq
MRLPAIQPTILGIVRGRSFRGPAPKHSAGQTLRSMPRNEESILMSNRKLIRPSLSEAREQMTARQVRRKPMQADHTNAENFYYVKQMQNRTPMVVVLTDGERLHGVIEWYDRNSLKLNRASEPALLVLKHNIKYMYKEDGESD